LRGKRSMSNTGPEAFLRPESLMSAALVAFVFAAPTG
jgi:hypothetical protein